MRMVFLDLGSLEAPLWTFLTMYKKVNHFVFLRLLDLCLFEHQASGSKYFCWSATRRCACFFLDMNLWISWYTLEVIVKWEETGLQLLANFEMKCGPDNKYIIWSWVTIPFPTCCMFVSWQSSHWQKNQN